jgi:hypothetical protein
MMEKVTPTVVKALLKDKVVVNVDFDTNGDFEVCEILLHLQDGSQIKFCGSGNSEIVAKFESGC